MAGPNATIFIDWPGLALPLLIGWIRQCRRSQTFGDGGDIRVSHEGPSGVMGPIQKMELFAFNPLFFSVSPTFHIELGPLRLMIGPSQSLIGPTQAYSL